MPKIKQVEDITEKRKAIIKVVDLMVRFKITPQDIVNELAYAIELNKQFSKK